MYKIIVYTIVVISAFYLSGDYACCAPNGKDAFAYDAKGKRDPFIPLIGQERGTSAGLENIASPDDINLEGIAIGAGGKQIAILNGQMVKENDKFGALVINKISRKSVELSIEGRSYTLSIQETEKDNAGGKQ